MHQLPQRTSLVAQTCTILRECLTAGEWQGHLPGELELCRRLRVSRVTLRAALARLQEEGCIGGGQGKRRAIIAQPSPAKSRRVKKPDRVILLSPEPLAKLNSSKLLWMDELREHVAAQGLGMDFIVSAAASRPRPARVLAELTEQHPGAVWVLLRASPQKQRWFQDAKLPVVVAGSHYPGIALPCVDIDYHATCRHAAGRLLAKGCGRLGLVIPQEMMAGDRDSEAGFRSGAGAHPVVVARHDGTPDGLCRSLDAMLRESPPQGFLVCHSTHAVTALSHLLRRGYKVPQQMLLIARDDDPFLEHVTPAPARYAMSPVTYARHVARLIGRLLDGEHPVKADLLLPKFLPGGTMG